MAGNPDVELSEALFELFLETDEKRAVLRGVVDVKKRTRS
jgi:hypothetical protein